MLTASATPLPRAGAAAEAEPQRGQGDSAEESPAGGRRWLPPGPARQVRLPPRHRAGSVVAVPPPGRWDGAGAAPTAPGTALPRASAGIRGCSTGGDTRSPPGGAAGGAQRAGGCGCCASRGGGREIKGGWCSVGQCGSVMLLGHSPMWGLGPPRQHPVGSGPPQPLW